MCVCRRQWRRARHLLRSNRQGAAEVGTLVITILDITSEKLLVEAEFFAEFVIQPESTGRFAGASGSWFVIANTEPFILGSDDPVAYTWVGEGSITLPK